MQCRIFHTLTPPPRVLQYLVGVVVCWGEGRRAGVEGEGRRLAQRRGAGVDAAEETSNTKRNRIDLIFRKSVSKYDLRH